MGVGARGGTVVTDESRIRHRLTEELGRGGQGAVWRTEAEGVAVKINSDSDSDRGHLRDRLREVSRMDLGDLAVAAPRSLLQEPWSGYVMDLVTGVVPVGVLGPLGTGQLANTGDESVPEWYVSTGGITRRLAVLASLCDLLSAIHARGLVYGDLNPGNVLVSGRTDRYVTYLVDLDNLTHRGAPGPRTFTPPYASPEAPTSGATSASDSFSALVLAYGLLTTVNPYYGEQVDQWPVERLYEHPWASAAPYVDHATDVSNRSQCRLDPSRVVPPRLRRLLDVALSDPERIPSRPTAAAISAAARSGLAAEVECSCGWQGFVNDRECYACDQPRSSTAVRVLEGHWDGSWAAFGRVPLVGLDSGRKPKRLTTWDLGYSEVPVDALSLHMDGDSLCADALSARLTVREVSAGTLIERAHRTPLLLVA